MSNSSFHKALLVAVGGGGGALARAGLDYAAALLPATLALPWSTIAVNLIGAFLLGVFTALWSGSAANSRGQTLLLLFGTGFCGAFTTYSAFALALLQKSTTWVALLSEAAFMLVAGVALAALGFFWKNPNRKTGAVSKPEADAS